MLVHAENNLGFKTSSHSVSFGICEVEISANILSSWQKMAELILEIRVRKCEDRQEKGITSLRIGIERVCFLT